MGGFRLLYSVKYKNCTKCKNFAVLLCFYVNTFILLYFLRWQEGGGYSPPSHPPRSATDYIISTFSLLLVLLPLN